MTRPSEYDSIWIKPSDPPGWHVREKTTDGYPLMGSSPAERQDAAERTERARLAAMRDHPFVGEGRYCAAMLGPRFSGNPATTGVVTMSIGCGYPADLHPVSAS